MHKWQLHEAKNKLSNLIDLAMNGKSQFITRHGEDAAVVIGIEEYKKLKTPKPTLKEFLLQGPKFDDLKIKRIRGVGAKTRDLDL